MSAPDWAELRRLVFALLDRAEKAEADNEWMRNAPLESIWAGRIAEATARAEKAEAERDRFHDALNRLRMRIDEMPNPHSDPMRHYYNQMQTWKDDLDHHDGTQPKENGETP